MKKTIAMLVVLMMALTSFMDGAFNRAEAAETADSDSILYNKLLADLLDAYVNKADIDVDAEAKDDPIARSIAENWQKVYLDPDYKLYLYGTDDPAALPIAGRHAFVVLGYQLKDGEMTEELIGRCDAAAAAALVFPESILVCTGGATGKNNPEGHTEAGLMKDYLVNELGISPDRVFIDENAMTTAENAINTFEILREQGIETMTIVTSSYHQRRGQVLYNALAAIYRQQSGYSAEIIGNFCLDIEPENAMYRQDAQIAITQLAMILAVSHEKTDAPSP